MIKINKIYFIYYEKSSTGIIKIYKNNFKANILKFYYIKNNKANIYIEDTFICIKETGINSKPFIKFYRKYI